MDHTQLLKDILFERNLNVFFENKLSDHIEEILKIDSEFKKFELLNNYKEIESEMDKLFEIELRMKKVKDFCIDVMGIYEQKMKTFETTLFVFDEICVYLLKRKGCLLELLLKQNLSKKEIETTRLEFSCCKETITHFSQQVKESKRNRSLKEFFNVDDLYCLEGWCNLKYDKVIFSSEVDDWGKVNSDFGTLLLNQSQILIVIKLENNSIIGGFVSSKINTKAEFIGDPKSFLFSILPKSKLKKREIFPIENKENSFFLCGDSSDCLFGFGKGFDLALFKKGTKNGWYYKEGCFGEFEEKMKNQQGLPKVICFTAIHFY